MNEQRVDHGGRRQDVQVLRGVAVLLVVAFHAKLPIDGGFVGVDMFFVISGFVISRMLLRELAETGAISLRRFYLRRVQRLLPMLALTLVATTIVSYLWLGSDASAQTAGTALAASLFSANIFLGRQSQGYFDVALTDNALLHTWSLSVEEQFYFVIPAALLVAWKLGARRRSGRAWVLAAIVAMGATSFAFAMVTSFGRGEALATAVGFDGPEALFFYLPVSRAWEFLAGGLLAGLEHRLHPLGTNLRRLCTIAGVSLVGAVALTADGTTGFTIFQAGLAVAGAVLLLVPGCHAPGHAAVPNPHWARPLVGALEWVGDRSYTWYLAHWPLVVFTSVVDQSAAALVGASCVALLVADLASRTVEHRFRYTTTLTPRQVGAVALLCSVAPMAVGAFSLLADSRLPVRQLTEAGRAHLQYDQPCSRSEMRGDAKFCFVGERSTGRLDEGAVFLMGDSHAGQWSEAVDGVTAERDVALVVVEHDSCPMLLGLEADGEGRGVREGCTSSIEEAYAAIDAHPPLAVFLGFASLAYVNDDSISLAVDGGEMTNQSSEKAMIWERALRQTLSWLDERNVPTVVIRDNPYSSLPPDHCGRLRLALTGCERPQSRASAEAARASTATAEAAASAHLDDLVFVDPFDAMCDDTACPNVRDGVWLFRDEDHVSVATSEMMTPWFDRALDEVTERG